MQRRKVILAVKVAVTLALFAVIFFKVPWDKLWTQAHQLDGRVWLGVLGAFWLGHLVGVFKWRFNVNVGKAGLGALDAVQCYAAGLFSNLFLPSIVGGDALKAFLAGKVTGRFEAAIFGGLTERLIDTAALLVLIVIGGLVSHTTVEGWSRQVILVSSLIAIAAALLFTPIALRVKLARWPRKLRRPLGRAMVAMRRLIRQPLSACAVFALSLVIQSWFVVLNYWLGRGIGIDIPLAFWFLAVPLTKAITLAPISFGGFGLRELALAGILALAGVPNDKGVAVSLLWQSIIVSTGLFGGVVWFALGYRSKARTGGGHGSLIGEARTAESRHA